MGSPCSERARPATGSAPSRATRWAPSCRVWQAAAIVSSDTQAAGSLGQPSTASSPAAMPPTSVMARGRTAPTAGPPPPPLQGAVWSCAINDSALLAATGSADFTACLWDPISGERKTQLQHKHIVRARARACPPAARLGGPHGQLRCGVRRSPGPRSATARAALTAPPCPALPCPALPCPATGAHSQLLAPHRQAAHWRHGEAHPHLRLPPARVGAARDRGRRQQHPLLSLDPARQPAAHLLPGQARHQVRGWAAATAVAAAAAAAAAAEQAHRQRLRPSAAARRHQAPGADAPRPAPPPRAACSTCAPASRSRS
jgi:hypothetical protein